MNNEEIRAVIAKYLRLRARNNKDVYTSIGMPKATYFQRLSKPEDFRVQELRKIFDYLKIPHTERII